LRRNAQEFRLKGKGSAWKWPTFKGQKVTNEFVSGLGREKTDASIEGRRHSRRWLAVRRGGLSCWLNGAGEKKEHREKNQIFSRDFFHTPFVPKKYDRKCGKRLLSHNKSFDKIGHFIGQK